MHNQWLTGIRSCLLIVRLLFGHVFLRRCRAVQEKLYDDSVSFNPLHGSGREVWFFVRLLLVHGACAGGCDSTTSGDTKENHIEVFRCAPPVWKASSYFLLLRSGLLMPGSCCCATCKKSSDSLNCWNRKKSVWMMTFNCFKCTHELVLKRMKEI